MLVRKTLFEPQGLSITYIWRHIIGFSRSRCTETIDTRPCSNILSSEQTTRTEPLQFCQFPSQTHQIPARIDTTSMALTFNPRLHPQPLLRRRPPHRILHPIPPPCSAQSSSHHPLPLPLPINPQNPLLKKPHCYPHYPSEILCALDWNPEYLQIVSDSHGQLLVATPSYLCISPTSLTLLSHRSCGWHHPPRRPFSATAGEQLRRQGLHIWPPHRSVSEDSDMPLTPISMTWRQEPSPGIFPNTPPT